MVINFFDPRVEKKEELHEGLCSLCGNERELPYRWPLNVEPRLQQQICEKCKEVMERVIR
jgi:hypothetical protein